ncbi:unnamed protein product [Amoebophrya sp. A25]|nr:unnamed protein product [Amoebophrya sp. A25]|eukprot:GSA25T00024361001.1
MRAKIFRPWIWVKSRAGGGGEPRGHIGEVRRHATDRRRRKMFDNPFLEPISWSSESDDVEADSQGRSGWRQLHAAGGVDDLLVYGNASMRTNSTLTSWDMDNSFLENSKMVSLKEKANKQEAESPAMSEVKDNHSAGSEASSGGFEAQGISSSSALTMDIVEIVTPILQHLGRKSRKAHFFEILGASMLVPVPDQDGSGATPSPITLQVLAQALGEQKVERLVTYVKLTKLYIQTLAKESLAGEDSDTDTSENAPNFIIRNAFSGSEVEVSTNVVSPFSTIEDLKFFSLVRSGVAVAFISGATGELLADADRLTPHMTTGAIVSINVPKDLTSLVSAAHMFFTVMTSDNFHFGTPTTLTKSIWKDANLLRIGSSIIACFRRAAQAESTTIAGDCGRLVLADGMTITGTMVSWVMRDRLTPLWESIWGSPVGPQCRCTNSLEVSVRQERDAIQNAATQFFDTRQSSSGLRSKFFLWGFELADSSKGNCVLIARLDIDGSSNVVRWHFFDLRDFRKSKK